MKRCVLSLERNIGREDEFRVSGGSEFQRRGPMTEKALLPSDDRTYGMERTSQSEDRVETECDGNERLYYCEDIEGLEGKGTMSSFFQKSLFSFF